MSYFKAKPKEVMAIPATDVQDNISWPGPG
jgi:hypothetical protein